MRKFKETITALIGAGGIGVMRVRRTENPVENMEVLGILFNFLTKVAVIAAVAAVIIFLDIWKLLAIIVGMILFTIIYLLSKE